MAQVNNNAESLSRELRKFKNLKSVDFKGLLSGTPDSYVNLYRYMFCENNIGFSQLVLEKGYDLSGLNDFKFMEAIYRLMRDLLNMKPPINQSQFFSPGFTQRKLEMSTQIASQVRKISNELATKNGKKTVQTPSLMKSSLKRANSVPKQPRIIEMGDESDISKNKVPFERYKKTKSSNTFSDKIIADKPKRDLSYDDNSQSSDEQSKVSDASGSYNSHSRMNGTLVANNYEVRPKTHVERVDTTVGYNSVGRTSDYITRSNYEARSQPLLDSTQYSPAYNYQRPSELADMSAFETVPGDNERYKSFNPRIVPQERLYDVKHYAPLSANESFVPKKEQSAPQWEKIMQQFDTVLARITLLEGRMQRIETKLDANASASSDRHNVAPSYVSQGNHLQQAYIASYDPNHATKISTYSNKNDNSVKGIKESIPDFESSHQPLRPKPDSERSYTSSNYSTNYKTHSASDYGHTAPRYAASLTNYSEKSGSEVHGCNGTKEHLYPLSSTYSSSQSHSSPTSKPAAFSASNGIPPLHPKTRAEAGGLKEHRYSRQADEKVLSQTDRIASMLSDTQKMLRLSDEEL